MTKQQAILLQFLRARALADDVSPSFREMAAHLGLHSTSGVRRILDALVRDGHLIRPQYLRSGAVPRGFVVRAIDDYARGYRDGQRDARADAVPVRRYEGLDADVIGDLSPVLAAGV
jgi:SOS-response transcriptional repressor LexA